jgi:hypothetical protein
MHSTPRDKMHAQREKAALLETQVRFRRHRFSATGDLAYRRARGAEG